MPEKNLEKPEDFFNEQPSAFEEHRKETSKKAISYRALPKIFANHSPAVYRPESDTSNPYTLETQAVAATNAQAKKFKLEGKLKINAKAGKSSYFKGMGITLSPNSLEPLAAMVAEVTEIKPGFFELVLEKPKKKQKQQNNIST